MFKDYVSLAFNAILRRRKRSILTLLGIIIGIAAVVSLITLGQGLKNAITGQFNALGSDKLIIAAKGNALSFGLSTDAVKITNKDLETIRQTSGIERTAGWIYSTAKIEYNDNVRYFMISGYPTAKDQVDLLWQASNYKLLKGRLVEEGDTYKAVLGFDYTKSELFGEEIDLGDKITIQDQEFKVIGFWDRTGSPPDDQGIIIPYQTYEELFNKHDEVGIIIAQIQSGENIDLVSESLKKELRKDRRVEEGKEDFSIETPNQLSAAFTTIIDMVQVVLIGIAAISLAVGGVGITNTMYTNVLERTREIGLLKAIGAKRKDIITLFVLEAGMYGLVGGIIGLIIGSSFALAVEAIFSVVVGPFLDVQLDPFLLIGSLLFAFILGCIAGITPARRAAKLSPVEALRYD